MTLSFLVSVNTCEEFWEGFVVFVYFDLWDYHVHRGKDYTHFFILLIFGYLKFKTNKVHLTHIYLVSLCQ